jgi:hypothetical protein
MKLTIDPGIAREYVWLGIDKDGNHVRGTWHMKPVHLAAVVEGRHEEGWRALGVSLDGRMVAGIPQERKPGDPAWWADSPKAAPMTADARWQALKDYLEDFAREFEANARADRARGVFRTRRGSDTRDILAKMTELEQS